VGTEARARLGLSALLLFTLWSFAEVIRGGQYPGPTILGMGLAGGIAIATRRLGRGALLGFVVSAIALAWYVCLVFASSATLYGLPTANGFSKLVNWVTEAARKSSTDVAPAPVRPGYVVMVVVGMWIASAIGETAAFRWQRPLLAVLPCMALFSLVLIVGTGTAAPVLVAVFLALLLTFWGLESSNRLRSWGRWVPTWPGHPEEPPPEITGSLARRMATWCVAAAVITPILLPLGHGLVDWRTGVNGGSTGSGGIGGVSTIDPLVSIAPTLLKQTNQELLRVKSNVSSYWRLQTLAAFDGTSWSSATKPSRPTTGSIHLSQGALEDTTLVTQTFSLTHLQTRFLPAAVNPADISFGGVGVSPPSTLLSDPATGDLELQEPTSGGLTYRVRSEVPNVSYKALLADHIGDPGPAYLQLPDKLSQTVIDLARRWTSGASTSLDKLLAIQRHLRHFQYRLNVRGGASTDYLTAFLTKIKAGFCQQFATAFTILARIEGFPTRIAVGFLPGSEAQGTHTFVVRGMDAHAWPEVYFANHGWLRFEPTPRVAAAVPRYAKIPASLGGPGAGGARNGRGAGNTVRGQLNKANVDLRTGASRGFVPKLVSRHRSGTPEWEKAFSRFGRTLLLLLVLVLVAIPILKAVRSKFRYLRAGGARDVAGAAFAQFEDEAAELAEPRAPSETAAAYVERLLTSNKLSARAALGLTRIYERAEYSASGIEDLEAEEAKRLVRQLRTDLWSSASWWDKAERIFSPRSLARRP
jgi:transglutaminase-like putative cysteine protease